MREDDNENNTPVIPVPPARLLDFEYLNQCQCPEPEPEQEPACGRGVATACTTCGSTVLQPYGTTLYVWDALLEQVADVTHISRKALQRPSGGRPSKELLDARALLVQALRAIAGRAAAYRWLKLLGWSMRRIRVAMHLELPRLHTDTLQHIGRVFRLPQDASELHE